ncbi:MAG: hypothetical protein LBT89_03440 [Planctomycetaceae bacterium]|nr:hypothetical protein [Planctomycetaceae bacterium]
MSIGQNGITANQGITALLGKGLIQCKTGISKQFKTFIDKHSAADDTEHVPLIDTTLTYNRYD